MDRLQNRLRSVARLLIELAIALGWKPDGSRQELLVEDGYALLREHEGALAAALELGEA